MKKTLCLLTVLCLLPVLAFAQGMPATFDLGNFTMDLDPDMTGEIADEINENEAFVFLLPFYDENATFNTSMNIIWTSETIAVTDKNAQKYLTTVTESMVDNLSQQGIELTNFTGYKAAVDDVGGKPAIVIVYSFDCDYSGAGLDLQLTLYWAQASVSIKDVGTYTFTITSDDLDELYETAELLNTIRWKV